MPDAAKVANLNRAMLVELVEQHGVELYRFCRQLAATRADADDLYQETFLAAVERWQKIDERRNPKAYLISIALYIWKSNRRKYARRQRLAPSTPIEDIAEQAAAADVEADLIRQDLRNQVQSASDALDDKLRIPLYLHYTLGMTVSEIAIALGVPGGTVKSRLHRARMLIKQRLEACGYEAG